MPRRYIRSRLDDTSGDSEVFQVISVVIPFHVFDGLINVCVLGSLSGSSYQS